MYPNTDNCEPCPSPITPIPIPNFNSILCNSHYNGGCALYTGPDIDCLGIKHGMDFNHISEIFCDALNNICDIKSNCVLSPEFGPWGECTCVTVDRVVTCTQTRTQLISIPASNGGHCFPAVETRDCTPRQMCFQFSGGLTETSDGAYFIADSQGYYNGKTYYEFIVSGNNQAIWYSTTDNKWHLSSVLGTPNSPCDFTLDNNSNDYPESNTTNYLWHNPSDGCYLFLLQSSLTAVPDTCASEYKICIELKLTIGGRVYKFKNLLAPSDTPFNTFDHPHYNYNVNVGGVVHTIQIFYGDSQWVVNDNVLGNIGSLNSSSFYPVGNNWIPNPASPDSQILVTTLGGTCVQDPDVDCTYVCGPWSTACILKPGTIDTYINTRTCTAVGPTGNGNPCPPPDLERGCTPPCTPPSGMTLYLNFFGCNASSNAFGSVNDACYAASLDQVTIFKNIYALNLNIGTTLYTNQTDCTALLPDGFYAVLNITNVPFPFTNTSHMDVQNVIYEIVNHKINSITNCCKPSTVTYGTGAKNFNSTNNIVTAFTSEAEACGYILSGTPVALLFPSYKDVNNNIPVINTKVSACTFLANGNNTYCNYTSAPTNRLNCYNLLPDGWYTYLRNGARYTIHIINNIVIAVNPCICTPISGLHPVVLLVSSYDTDAHADVTINDAYTACRAGHHDVVSGVPHKTYITVYSTDATIGLYSTIYPNINACFPGTPPSAYNNNGWYAILGTTYNTKVHITNGVVDIYEVCTTT